MIMNNVVSAEMRTNPNVKLYDLKGSTVGRYTEDRNILDESKIIRKDLNFLLDLDARIPFSSETERESFFETVAKDALFLCSEKMLDYSLLLAIDIESNTWSAGIIDIFTKFNSMKFVECHLMGAIQGDISCKVPRYYAERFLKLFL